MSFLELRWICYKLLWKIEFRLLMCIRAKIEFRLAMIQNHCGLGSLMGFYQICWILFATLGASILRCLMARIWMLLVVVFNVFHWLLVVCIRISLSLALLLVIKSCWFITFIRARNVVRETWEDQLRNVDRSLRPNGWSIDKQFVGVTYVEAELVLCFTLKLLFSCSFSLLRQQEFFEAKGVDRFDMFFKYLGYWISFTLEQVY